MCSAGKLGPLLLAVGYFACARDATNGRRTTDKSAPLATDDPLVPAAEPPLSPESPVSSGETPSPRIHVTSASFGTNCRQPTDNDTLYMGRRCDGRTRCERRLVARPIASVIGNGRKVSCDPEYQVQWTCDGDPHPHVLRSIPSEEDTLHFRLGCGLEDPARLRTMAAQDADSPVADGDERTVRGQVLTKDGIGWSRATVTIGESSVRADSKGRFVVQGVPKTYDIRIGWTMFLGLTRRDPVFVVGGSYHPQYMRYHAVITDAVSTQIVSNQGKWARRILEFLAPGAVTAERSRSYVVREREVGWRGDDTVTGLFVSLMNDGPKDDPWASSFLATEKLSLTDGDSVAAAPRLRKIGSGRIAGTASLRGPAWPSQTPENLRFSYVVPGLTGKLDLGACPADGKFDCRLPDLSELGGEYCMEIGVGEKLDNPRVSRCGGQLGMRDFSEPPTPAAPVMRHGAAVEQDTMIAWTGEGHVFEVRMGPGWNNEAPIRFFTSKRSLSWSDFLALGMTWDAFVRESESYHAGDPDSTPTIDVNSVGSLHPYESMNDLVSTRNLMIQGASWQKVPSPPRSESHPEKGWVTLPKPVASRLQAIRERDTQPLDLFHLPACESTDGATAMADIRPALVETRVALRGTLTWTGDWACTLKGCDCCNHCGTKWIVTDSKTPGNGMLLHPTGHRGNLGMGANECGIPKTPSIDVIATGVLLPTPRWTSEPRYHRYLLDDASLCAVRSEAEHP